MGPDEATLWSARERERLERIAAWYTNREGISAMSGQATARFIVENAKPGGKMLEMGCGKGVVTEILAEHFVLHVVEGAEQNVRMVHNLLGDRAKIFRSLFEDFEPPGLQGYDDIVMGRMLGHVADAEAVLNRARSWLRDDGHIHIVVPNAESVHRRIGAVLGMLDTPWSQSMSDLAVGQRRLFDVRSLRTLVEQCGLGICALRGTLLKPFSSKQMESYPQELLDAFYKVGQQMPPEFTAEIYACCEVIADSVTSHE